MFILVNNGAFQCTHTVNKDEAKGIMQGRIRVKQPNRLGNHRVYWQQICFIRYKPFYMPNEDKAKKEQDRQNKDAAVKPDPETLHTTDPQENMEGPVSSLMHDAGEAFDTDEDKDEADQKKEENK